MSDSDVVFSISSYDLSRFPEYYIVLYTLITHVSLHITLSPTVINIKLSAPKAAEGEAGTVPIASGCSC